MWCILIWSISTACGTQGYHGMEKPGKSLEYGNAVFPVGKVGKKSGIQSIVTSKVELRNYSSYRNGRPLFGKCSTKEIQSYKFSRSRAKQNRHKIRKFVIYGITNTLTKRKISIIFNEYNRYSKQKWIYIFMMTTTKLWKDKSVILYFCLILHVLHL